MKIKEIQKVATLANIEVESIKELVKDKGYLYTIGVNVGDMSADMVAQHLHKLKIIFDNEGVNAFLYPIRDGIGEITIHKLEK